MDAVRTFKGGLVSIQVTVVYTLNYYDKFYTVMVPADGYTVQMSQWVRQFKDVHFVYSAYGMTIHFAQEEDLVAFKLAFKI